MTLEDPSFKVVEVQFSLRKKCRKKCIFCFSPEKLEKLYLDNFEKWGGSPVPFKFDGYKKRKMDKQKNLFQSKKKSV